MRNVIYTGSMQRIAELSARVAPIFKKYGIKRAKIFGSRARGDDHADSDVDILIDYGDAKFSLLDHVGLQQDISEALGVPTDVVTESAVHPLLRDSIVADARVIYEG